MTSFHSSDWVRLGQFKQSLNANDSLSDSKINIQSAGGRAGLDAYISRE